MRYLLEKIEKKNQCSLIYKCMYVKSCYKISALKTRNRTVILIFPIYCAYLLICCAIFSKGWWYVERWTDNRLVPRNGLWFRIARPVRQNNDWVMCFYILWCKKFKHENKIISNTMNLWLKSSSYSNISKYRTYLLTWYWDITNHLPIVFWNSYSTKRKTIHAY